MAAGIVLGRSSIVIGAGAAIGVEWASTGLASTDLTSAGLTSADLASAEGVSSGLAARGCISTVLTSAGPRVPPTPSVSVCLVGCSTVVLATGSVTTAGVTPLVGFTHPGADGHP